MVLLTELGLFSLCCEKALHGNNVPLSSIPLTVHVWVCVSWDICILESQWGVKFQSKSDNNEWSGKDESAQEWSLLIKYSGSFTFGLLVYSSVVTEQPYLLKLFCFWHLFGSANGEAQIYLAKLLPFYPSTSLVRLFWVSSQVIAYTATYWHNYFAGYKTSVFVLFTKNTITGTTLAENVGCLMIKVSYRSVAWAVWNDGDGFDGFRSETKHKMIII